MITCVYVAIKYFGFRFCSTMPSTVDNMWGDALMRIRWWSSGKMFLVWILSLPLTESRCFCHDGSGYYISFFTRVLSNHNKQKPGTYLSCGFFQLHKSIFIPTGVKKCMQPEFLSHELSHYSRTGTILATFCSQGFSNRSTLAKHRRSHADKQSSSVTSTLSHSVNMWRHD